MPEQFKPLPHISPDSFMDKLRFFIRLIFDFQVNSVYRDMKKYLPSLKGKVVDIGAGRSPYKHLINKEQATYIGIDSNLANEFDYNSQDILYYHGERLPFDDGSIDNIICTEVMEHLEKPEIMVKEMYRTLKPGGVGVITAPWSARFHYIPFDYYRFTPTMLNKLFKAFSFVKVEPRGTDITVIAAKIIVVYFCMFTSLRKIIINIILILLFSPVLVLSVLIGHLSLFFKLGSTNDPLGYTLWVKK